jgi:malate/lactate dehydrogenase
MTASERISQNLTSRRDPAWAVGNAKLVHQLVPQLAKLSPTAIFVNVTNPLDAITYLPLPIISTRRPGSIGIK